MHVESIDDSSRLFFVPCDSRELCSRLPAVAAAAARVLTSRADMLLTCRDNGASDNLRVDLYGHRPLISTC